jgi:hypothetical protein
MGLEIFSGSLVMRRGNYTVCTKRAILRIRFGEITEAQRREHLKWTFSGITEEDIDKVLEGKYAVENNELEITE